MNDYYPAFELSPVPDAGPDTSPPEIHRGIYAMPMFVTVPTPDLAASVDFWTRGLGFVDLFTVPDQITHLRRWAFQDVLLVPKEETVAVPALSVTFSAVLSQIDQVADACQELVPGCVTGPSETPWNTSDLEIITPENARVIITAAHPFDPDSAAARNIEAMGIEAPET